MSEEIKEENVENNNTVSKPEKEEEVGNIEISVDVVSTIAGIATMEISGVAGMYTSFANGLVEKFGAKKNTSRGVKVEMSETSASIDLYIVADYGVRIPELAWEIQENVKNNVETMTGLEVQKVNIHIEGVSFEKVQNDTQVITEIETESEEAAPVIENSEEEDNTDTEDIND